MMSSQLILHCCLLTYECVGAAVPGDQGAPAVSLARVLARAGGAHHVGADVRGGVDGAVTLAIGHGAHINLVKVVTTRSVKRVSPPEECWAGSRLKTECPSQ